MSEFKVGEKAVYRRGKLTEKFVVDVVGKIVISGCPEQGKKRYVIYEKKFCESLVEFPLPPAERKTRKRIVSLKGGKTPDKWRKKKLTQ